jgi:hypothetical protein
MLSKVSVGHVIVKIRSAKQIQASKTNGSLSRGPLSDLGKQRSSLNALKHGGYAHQYVVLGEDPEAFQEYALEMREHWQPRNIIEKDLVEQLIRVAWKIRRLGSLEAAVLSTEMLDYYRSDLLLDYRKPRKLAPTHLSPGARVTLSKNEELMAIAFKRDVNSHQSLVVLEEIQTRTSSKYFKLLEKLLEMKQGRYA